MLNRKEETVLECSTMEEYYLYKITCFAPILPERLEKELKGFRYKKTKQGFEWNIDKNYVFRIEPLRNPAYGKPNGYRVYFNRSIEGGAYLFDRFFGWLEPKITGIELDFSFAKGKTKKDYIDDFLNNKSYKLLDIRGLFKRGRTGIVVKEDGINLQIRSSKSKQLNLIDCLKEVQNLQEEITPDNFDLFSFLDEGEAV